MLLVVHGRVVHAVALDEVVVALDGHAERLEHVEERIFELRPRPLFFGLAAGKTQLAPNVVVGLALVHRLYGALRADDRVRDAVVRVHDGALHGAGHRQNEVGLQGRRRDVVVQHDEELDLLDGLVGHLRVAVRRQRVRARDQQGAHLVGVAGEDGLEHGRAVRLAHPLSGECLAPLALRNLGQTLVAGPRRHLVLVRAYLLGLHVVGQVVVALHLLVGDVDGRTGHAVAAGDVEVAADGTHDGAGVHAGAGALAQLIPSAAPLDVAGGVGRVHARGLANELGVEPGERGRPLRRVGLHGIAQLVDADAPLVHEVHVVDELVQDDVEHGQRQRRVRTRAQRQPQVCVRSRLGVARIHDDELQAGLALQIRVAVHAGHRRGAGVEAPQDDALRGAQVGLERRPAGDGRLNHEGGDPAQKRVVEAVGGAEEVQETATRPVVGAQSAGGGRHGLGAGLLLDLVEFLGDFRKRLVPRDALPLVLALLARTFERVVHARRVVHEIQRLVAARAQAALVRRVVRVAFRVDEFAVFYVGKHTAVLMAEVTTRFPHDDVFSVDIY